MQLTIRLLRESDGRWIGDVPELPNIPGSARNCRGDWAWRDDLRSWHAAVLHCRM